MAEASYTPPDVVDEDGNALPVPARSREVAERPDAVLMAPVAAATGGIVAGLATMMIVRGLRHRPKRVRVGGRRRGKALEVTATRSFLVDVHMLKRWWRPRPKPRLRAKPAKPPRHGSPKRRPSPKPRPLRTPPT